ncbi:MAG: hypothetical protein WC997_02165 [Porticoccaceae bacterium]
MNFIRSKQDVADSIRALERGLSFMRLIEGIGCSGCTNYTGRECALYRGHEVPEEVKRTGCPSWNWDQIPF